jgi:hypothetical protein
MRLTVLGVVGLAAVVLAGCGGADSGSGSADAEPGVSTPKVLTPRATYASALTDYQSGRARLRLRAAAHVKARDLGAVKSDFRRYRDVVVGFDRAVRAIDVPPDAKPEVKALLKADRTEIAGVDAVASVRSFEELQRLLATRLQADDEALGRALKRVTAVL